MRKIGFIGMGNMASAILNGMITSGFMSGEEVNAYDIDKVKMKEKLKFGVHCCESIETLVKESEIVFVAVKPQVVENIIFQIKELMVDKALISIVLGYDYDKYNEILDKSTRHIFVMPNTPAQVLEGMSLIEERHSLYEEEFEFTKKLFQSIGEVEIISSHLMGVGGALSGCGPAYIYMVIEAMADGAVKNGMPRVLAYKLAAQTVMGSGRMQKETKLHPGILKDNVCSPGGSTIRGVSALEKGKMRSLFIDAIDKSLNK